MADTKNFGLKGVGDDVQFGKAGGRFVYNTGASDFRATDSGGSTLVHLQVLDPVGDTDAATKLYVDNTAAGLDHKASVTCASTADVSGTYNATNGPLSNGQHTGVPASIDGVTLAQGDRVLLKNQSPADENGIYEVQATTTTLNRASDFDTDAEVTAGAFTFVEEGTANADSGWVLQGPDPLTVGTGGGSDLNFVLFSTSSDLLAGDAITKSGNTLNLDFVTGGGLTNSVATAVGDFIAFSDTDNSDAMQLRSWTNVLADLDIVTATANGMLARTANDTYASRTLTASAVAGDEGISIVNGDGVSGNPTIGVDILGQTNLVTDDVDDADELLLYHSVGGGSETAGNYAVTASKLKTYMNAGTSATSITEGDTTLAVSDSGTDGTLTFTADNVIQFTVDDTTFTTADNLNFSLAGTSSMTIASLTENDVMIVGASGILEDSAGALTFDGSVLALTGDQTISQSLYLIEQASAGADTATQGQLWTRTNTPNTSMFTGDTGIDFVTANVHETNYQYAVEVTDADPGAGLLRFDSVTIGSITEMYIDDTDNVGKDYAWALDNLAAGDILTIRSMADATDYIVASVTSAPTDNTGYWTIPLTLIHTGTIFTDDDQLVLTIEWQSQGVSATPTLITVADSTDTTSFPAFFEDATGDLGPKTDASNYTYNATSGALSAGSFIGAALTDNDVLVAGTGGVIEDSAGNLTWSGTNLGVTGSITTNSLTDNRVVIAGTSGILEDDANFTFNGTTLAVTGIITIDEITIDGDTISNNTTDQPLILNPNGTGSIIFNDGGGDPILELNNTVSAVNGLAISAGATGNPAQITTGTGSEANIDIGFLTNGTGVLAVTAGSGNYEDNVTADDDIPNKKYVDDTIGSRPGGVSSISGTIDLTTASTQSIGASDGIPANCTVMSVTVDVTTASDAVTTVTIGDVTNGAASYMAAAENDPEILDIYIADGRLLNGAGDRQANATVATPGTVGAATCIITYRLTGA